MVKQLTDMDGTTAYQAQYDGYWKSTDRIGETSGDMDRIGAELL